ncbi:hypothetical protein M3Y94_00016300 [Aphelenchoides besseyi]|nr:hypothetical protein M3Y94_00016300 [Aphelenchoides besseyi]KAI6216493.1 hypothetical protein M3Y95_01273100 [Aphelenchoides besseyi]
MWKSAILIVVLSLWFANGTIDIYLTTGKIVVGMNSDQLDVNVTNTKSDEEEYFKLVVGENGCVLEFRVNTSSALQFLWTKNPQKKPEPKWTYLIGNFTMHIDQIAKNIKFVDDKQTYVHQCEDIVYSQNYVGFEDQKLLVLQIRGITPADFTLIAFADFDPLTRDNSAIQFGLSIWLLLCLLML